MNKTTQTCSTAARGRTIRVGFVALNDCAPIVIAHEKRFFAAHGLSVSLHRELGWATVRDKIIYGELDATHALAAMPLAATLGLGSARADCIAAIVLNLNGNAITLSEKLWKRGVRDGRSLREEITRVRKDQMLTFGVVNRFSSHHHLLGTWFRAHGIQDRGVRIVVLPPSQMESNLACGNLDGFCVGDPWNSVAVKSGSGWIAATSAEIDRNHPEKVLMARADFAERHEAEHLAMVSALYEACAFCDNPANAAEVAEILSHPEYVGVPAQSIQAGLNGAFSFGHKKDETLREFCIFHRYGANEPSLARAAWIMELVRRSGACEEPSALNEHLARKVFRSEIFERAIRAPSNPVTKLYEEQNQLTAA